MKTKQYLPFRDRVNLGVSYPGDHFLKGDVPNAEGTVKVFNDGSSSSPT